MSPVLNRPVLRRLTTLGLRKGLLDGRSGWLAVGVVAGLLRIVRRLTTSKSDVIMCEELKPGDALVITNTRPS